MDQCESGLDRLFERLSKRSILTADDYATLQAVPVKRRTLAASQYLVREGQLPERCGVICTGFAYRQKLTVEGNRQITMLLVPGDILDLQNLYLHESDHDIQALTRMTIAEVSIDLVRAMVKRSPSIARALWADSLVECSIAREWLLNIGRRNARTRIAHLLCEFQIRVAAVDGDDDDVGYELPMTQEQLGDALGLTPVHVNRMLQSLERDGLIHRRQRRLTVPDWDALRAAAQFNPRYLHMSNAAA